MLRLHPLVSARALAKQLRMPPDKLLRRVGWTKKQKRYVLEVERDLPELDAGVYVTPSIGQCMVPATIACAVAEELGMRTQLVDPNPPQLQRAAAAGPSCTPVVAVLAHVDHGKTTLLDRLLGTDVAAGEVGLITQSVRPALLPLPRPVCGVSRLAFIDTPGHQAFQNMRSAATESADCALVLVAVDAGIQPQTKEARAASCRAPGRPALAAQPSRQRASRHRCPPLAATPCAPAHAPIPIPIPMHRWCAAARGAGSRWCSLSIRWTSS